VQHAWLGSVAELVVRSSPIPVLVVPREVPVDRDRILVAVDMREDASTQIVANASAIALRLGMRVDLLQVLVAPPYVALDATVDPPPMPGMVLVERDLEKLQALLPPEQRGTVAVEWGDPARSVAELARSHLLVVVGTHGRRGLERVLLGSVAEWIVRRCEVPVLVVPLIG
jgi:nucleotide-binding universal stress UspA family protein